MYVLDTFFFISKSLALCALNKNYFLFSLFLIITYIKSQCDWPRRFLVQKHYLWQLIYIIFILIYIYVPYRWELLMS